MEPGSRQTIRAVTWAATAVALLLLVYGAVNPQAPNRTLVVWAIVLGGFLLAIGWHFAAEKIARIGSQERVPGLRAMALQRVKLYRFSFRAESIARLLGEVVQRLGLLALINYFTSGYQIELRPDAWLWLLASAFLAFCFREDLRLSGSSTSRPQGAQLRQPRPRAGR